MNLIKYMAEQEQRRAVKEVKIRNKNNFMRNLRKKNKRNCREK